MLVIDRKPGIAVDETGRWCYSICYL